MTLSRTLSALVLATASLAQAAPLAPSPTLVTTARTSHASRLDDLVETTRRLPAERRVRVALEIERLLQAHPELFEAALALATQDSEALAQVRAADLAAARAFDAALLHGLGAARSPRALSVLTRAFENGATPRITAVAASGLGKLCDQGGFDVLARHARTGRPRARDAYEALGNCRTLRTAELLTSRLAEVNTAREARALARAIGLLGSTWAWEALGPSQANTGTEVRAHCTRALRDAYARHDDTTRSALRKALVMVAPEEAKKLPR